MELFKTNGQLKPRGALVAHHKVYVNDLAKQAWIEEREAEHKTLFPLKIDNPANVIDGEEPELMDNPNFISYDEWMSEEVITTAYQEATYEADGFTLLTPEIQEVKSLVREFVAPEVLESELDTYLANSAEYAKHLSKLKVDKLEAITVTHETVAYDAKGRSIGNMSAVVGVANARFNQYTSIGVSLDPLTPTVLTVLSNADAYQAIYKDTTVQWKGADNEIHTVVVESVVEALEKAMLEVAKVVVV